MATYKIETLHDGTWTTDGLGDPDANEFASREQAEQAITDLRTIGDDWAEAEYRVTEALWAATACPDCGDERNHATTPMCGE